MREICVNFVHQNSAIGIAVIIPVNETSVVSRHDADESLDRTQGIENIVHDLFAYSHGAVVCEEIDVPGGINAGRIAACIINHVAPDKAVAGRIQQNAAGIVCQRVLFDDIGVVVGLGEDAESHLAVHPA